MYELSADERNQANIWNKYAERGFLQSTIDPRDDKGLKCEYIDRWSRHYIRDLVQKPEIKQILEIGCGSGRNLFQISEKIDHGYGIDIAEAQIANAERIQNQKGIKNLRFFTDPAEFISLGVPVDSMMTMWVLAHFEANESLVSMLDFYRTQLPSIQHFVFFEQAATKTYTVHEGGRFYKKIRTLAEYERLFDQAGLRLVHTHILNEKGFGPLYRRVYMSRLYRYWPRQLNLNPVLFWLDRRLTQRNVADTFTDCAFVCNPVR